MLQECEESGLWDTVNAVYSGGLIMLQNDHSVILTTKPSLDSWLVILVNMAAFRCCNMNVAVGKGSVYAKRYMCTCSSLLPVSLCTYIPIYLYTI